MAKELKRHAKARIRPPKTAASRVDLRRQMATMMGEVRKEMERQSAPSQARKSVCFSVVLRVVL